MITKQLDMDEVKRLYLDEAITVSKIAEKMTVFPGVIRRALNNAGVLVTREEQLENYWRKVEADHKGLTRHEIAKSTGKSYAVVTWAYRKYGLKAVNGNLLQEITDAPMDTPPEEIEVEIPIDPERKIQDKIRALRAQARG